MKKLLMISLLILSVSIGCKKNDSSGGSGTGLNTYLPLTTNSTFTYSVARNGAITTPTYTVQTGDTTAFSKSYKRVKSTTGETSYYTQQSNDYYTLFSIPSLGGLELLFLKDNVAVNTTWSSTQNVGNINVPGVPLPVSVTINLEFKIASKASSRTVKGKVYNDIIQSQCTLTANTLIGNLPLGTAEFYFAKNVGIIESVIALNNSTAGINVNEKYELTSYDIK
jgi:hypothetical protein